MTEEEKRSAWEAGTIGTNHVRYLSTGALIRARDVQMDGCTVMGGTLETSQGATVPLRHAVRAFAFVRAIRDAGKGWEAKAGSRAIRVGHFTLDRVQPNGDFVAGCHVINWTETERLARQLGLWDCPATALIGDDEKETESA